jgi:hypothetical protein
LIVFIASIAVPILKIAALTLLAFTARRKSRWRQAERATLYRVLETVGHWSMLDVFRRRAAGGHGAFRRLRQRRARARACWPSEASSC